MSLTWATKDDFTIKLADRPGELATLAAKLRNAGVRLLGIWGDEEGDAQSRLHCVPETPSVFRAFAEKEGIEVESGLTVYIHGTDEEGALVETLEEIATAGVNINKIQATVASDDFGCFLWVEPKDIDAISRILC
jgi:hypothetical protein